MGILKDILFGSDKQKEQRKEKTERVDVRGHDERREVYDSQGHWKEEHRWNPHTDRWDKLDIHGDVIGHIERDSSGNMVHKDYYENVTQVDKLEDSRTVAHYDSKGNKTGYTTKDFSNNLTRHTYSEDKKEEGGHGLIGFLNSIQETADEYKRMMDELKNGYEEDLSEDEEDLTEEYYDYDLFDDEEEDDDPYADEYDEESEDDEYC